MTAVKKPTYQHTMPDPKPATEKSEFDILALISECALQGAEPSVLKELRELRRDMASEIDRRLFFAAMSRVQAELTQVATDAGNPQTNSRYATYAQLDRALRPHYTAEGFSIGFDDEPTEHGIRVECKVSRGDHHTTHHHTVQPTTHGIKGTQMMTQIHADASALSYGKRYTLAMAFNIAVERDDDGNAAGARTVTASQLDGLMNITKGQDSTAFCAWVSEQLGYKVENLSMVRQHDLDRVRSWLGSAMKAKAISQEPAA